MYNYVLLSIANFLHNCVLSTTDTSQHETIVYASRTIAKYTMNGNKYLIVVYVFIIHLLIIYTLYNTRTYSTQSTEAACAWATESIQYTLTCARSFKLLLYYIDMYLSLAYVCQPHRSEQI